MRFQGLKVLVTGGAGFVGSNLVNRLVEEGAKVTVLDDLFTGRRENIAYLDDIKFVEPTKIAEGGILNTGIQGFDGLFQEGGIPRGNSVLVAGGTGTGKSTFCRQICYNLISQGKLYVCQF